MDERSNQQLKSALSRGDLSPRKKAFAEEVLRRRYEAKDGGRLWKYAWLPILVVLSLAWRALRQLRVPRE
jgi:hypothetical protein